MIKEKYFLAENADIYYRYSLIDSSKPTILFLHGLGESGLCFREAFETPAIAKNFNLLVPDLAGFGRSSAAKCDDYRFFSQIRRVKALCGSLGLKEYFLVGHSMGGDLGTLLCKEVGLEVMGFVNVEGNLTLKDRFISDEFVAADETGYLETWLEGVFIRQTLQGIMDKYPDAQGSCQRYVASLRSARIKALATSVHEIHLYHGEVKDDAGGAMGKRFVELRQPKIFCWGEWCLDPFTRDYIKDRKLEARSFLAHHWVMIDASKEFYRFLGDFFQGLKPK